jgi:uncharacterized membrane protein YbaN (DUF454 family)
METIWWIFGDVLFHSVFGRLGHWFVRAVTFGKVDMDWETGGESALAGWIGIMVALGLVFVGAWIFQSPPAVGFLQSL